MRNIYSQLLVFAILSLCAKNQVDIQQKNPLNAQYPIVKQPNLGSNQSEETKQSNSALPANKSVENSTAPTNQIAIPQKTEKATKPYDISKVKATDNSLDTLSSHELFKKLEERRKKIDSIQKSSSLLNNKTEFSGDVSKLVGGKIDKIVENFRDTAKREPEGDKLGKAITEYPNKETEALKSKIPQVNEDQKLKVDEKPEIADTKKIPPNNEDNLKDDRSIKGEIDSLYDKINHLNSLIQVKSKEEADKNYSKDKEPSYDEYLAKKNSKSEKKSLPENIDSKENAEDKYFSKLKYEGISSDKDNINAQISKQEELNSIYKKIGVLKSLLKNSSTKDKREQDDDSHSNKEILTSYNSSEPKIKAHEGIGADLLRRYGNDRDRELFRKRSGVSHKSEHGDSKSENLQLSTALEEEKVPFEERRHKIREFEEFIKKKEYLDELKKQAEELNTSKYSSKKFDPTIKQFREPKYSKDFNSKKMSKEMLSLSPFKRSNKEFDGHSRSYSDETELKSLKKNTNFNDMLNYYGYDGSHEPVIGPGRINVPNFSSRDHLNNEVDSRIFDKLRYLRGDNSSPYRSSSDKNERNRRDMERFHEFFGKKRR